MALMRRGSLFAGALFAGALFGVVRDEATQADALPRYGGEQREDLSVERVLESWEWLDAQRSRQEQDWKDRIAPVDEVEFTTGATSPSVQDEPPGIIAIAMPITKIHDADSADKAVLADQQRRNRRAMLMLLAMVEDDD
jgi:hypothetical protein